MLCLFLGVICSLLHSRNEGNIGWKWCKCVQTFVLYFFCIFIVSPLLGHTRLATSQGFTPGCFFIWDRNVQLSNLFIVCSVPLAAINISLSKPYPLKNPFFILQILMPCYYQGFPCSSTCMNFVDCIFKILIHLIVNYVYKKYELWIIQAYWAF